MGLFTHPLADSIVNYKWARTVHAMQPYSAGCEIKIKTNQQEVHTY